MGNFLDLTLFRTINSVASKHGKADEVLVRNF